MTDTPKRSTATTARRPDCVTEVRRGNTVLVVSGYFKQGTTATAADKMMKVLEAESAAGGTAAHAMRDSTSRKNKNDKSSILPKGVFEKWT